MKLNNTPPTMINNRCHAGLARNSHGCIGCCICSVSIDSSIIPAIFHIATQRQPTDTIFRITVLRLKLEQSRTKGRRISRTFLPVYFEKTGKEGNVPPHE